MWHLLPSAEYGMLETLLMAAGPREGGCQTKEFKTGRGKKPCQHYKATKD